MALNNIIRRAASSKVIPLAFRVTKAAQAHNHHSSAVCNTRFLVQRAFPSRQRCYSARPSSDEKLLSVLDSEIQCAEETEEVQAEGVPSDFPFKIEDEPGQDIITLTREYQGENISIEVHMPDPMNGEEEEEDNYEGGQETEKDQSYIPLVVRVSKKNTPTLEFTCTANPDEISIDSLSVKNPDSTEDQIPYEGPDFGDLDENLQKAFHKYLEVRGIKPSTMSFLHGYMLAKESREYVTWLKNMHKFVEA